jgi:hypothetical protein
VLGDAGNGERLRVHLSGFDVGRVVGAKRRGRWVWGRWLWVVLTRCCVVRAWFGSERVGVHDFVYFELAAVLSTLGRGSRGRGLLTLECPNLLCYSFALFCFFSPLFHPFQPLPLLTSIVSGT